MSPNRHSISAISTAKKFKTPLKASVVLLTTMILAACNTTDDPSYKLEDIFSPLPGATDKEVEKAKAEAEKAKAEAKKAKEEAEKAKAEAAAKIAAAEKAAEEKAQAAIKAKENAEAAAAAAEIAKAEAIKAKEDAQKALEDALANGGGSEALQKEAARKAQLAQQAQIAADSAQAAAVAAQEKAQVEATAAAAAQTAALNAAVAAEIKNAAETKKSGVQHISIDASILSQGKLTTTTRDFKITDATQVDARADTASGGLVSDPVVLKVSGDNDVQIAGSSGFKSFENTTKVKTASIGEVDLVYTSTYKDFGDELRIAHIDGVAGPLPVNGVAIVGNATKAENVPTEGSVKYSGDATYRKLGVDSNIEFGTSVFTADFVAKNLKGDLTFNDKKVGLEATIAGNKFSGSQGGYNTDGGFFGGDAQYLGGVYEGNGAQGTYGAKSDKQTAAEKAAVDAKATADAKAQALAAAQVQAAAAQAAATKAQADAAKAKAEAEKAQQAADNAGNSGDDQALQEALDRAAAAEAAAEKAKADAAIAIQEAANKAKEEVKAAQDKVTAAQAETAAAQSAAAAAKAETAVAEKDAAAKIAAAESAATKDIAAAKEEARVAQEKATAAKVAQDKAEADAKAAQDRAVAAAAAQAAAEQKAKELQDQLDKLTPKVQSGVQSLNIGNAFVTTERDFVVNADGSLEARADLASEGKLPKVLVNISGNNDITLDNGYKSNVDDSTTIVTSPELGSASIPLTYTSVYKDFGSDMRVSHINGTADATGLGMGPLPVDGVIVVGNATTAVPTEGVFNYAGDATNRKNGIGNAIEYGTSAFKADFVGGKIDGTLSFVTAGDINLKADITGNKFSGTAAVNGGYNTEGGFYGDAAKNLGGIYEGNGAQGTYGAIKGNEVIVTPPAPPVNENNPVDSNMTGVQSFTLSNADAIGFRSFWNDKDSKGATDRSDTFVNTGDGDNFTAFDKLTARADLTKPDTVEKSVTATIASAGDGVYASNTKDFKVYSGSTNVNVLKPFKLSLTLPYQSVYKNFDEVMQIGHVTGDANSPFGKAARVSSVYVQGKLTAAADMNYMKDLAQFNKDTGVNDGLFKYAGNATYVDNLHFNAADRTVKVDGVSNFDVDFVNDTLTGNLAFDSIDKSIDISAAISGNSFAGTSASKVQTSGGFYGEDAKFLGGIYQEALQPGGSGTTNGTGTTFQGTFGAEKQ